MDTERNLENFVAGGQAAQAAVDAAMEQTTAPAPGAPAPKAKKPKRQSRADRWNEAVGHARTALDAMTAARDELVAALGDVKAIQEDFESWKDNLPESFQGTTLGEKLEAVCEFDLEPDENSGVDDFEELVGNLEGADLPLGFGRD